jgi:SAM-dependent methyltransferase/Tfp pilus assembly protein PilF
LAQSQGGAAIFGMTNAGTDALLANLATERLLKEASRHLQSRDVVRVEQLCRQALAAEPAASDAWHFLAIALAEQRRFADAARAAQRAIELLPGNARYWVTHGIIALDQNLLPEAQASFQHALQLDPKLSAAHYLLGRSYHRADQLAEAIGAYRKALRGAPEVADIRFELARALLQTDRAEEALAAFQEAFARDREGRLDRRECFDCFRRLPIRSLPTFWQTELTGFFSRQDIDKSRYAVGGLYVLAAKPAFRALLGGGDGHQGFKPELRAVGQVMDDPLFGLLLRDAVIGHPQFERLLTGLRRELLFDGALRARAPLQFICDLALQCFNNEFVYAESEAETAKVAELAAEVECGLRAAGSHDEPFLRSLAVLATYRPVHALPGIDALSPELAGAAGPMLRRTVTQVLEERKLGAGLPVIGQIADAVSHRVRAQYEENPYPRWIAFDRDPPVSASDWIGAELPGVNWPQAWPDSLNVLVAGCGTGLEAVSLAAKIAEVRVTAVDLSRASLAYAQRKANDLGLTNIKFFQADILELAGLPERFDAVLSVGVLHHMREPQAGLRVLAGVARPGGLIKIGLYSARARGSVNAVRDFIRARQLAPADAAIRAIRQEVLRSDRNSPLAGLLRWRDFFTMSECRDLLFHVQEHQFTLPQIADMLRSEQLTVLGLSRQLPRASMRAYRQMRPNDESMADLPTWDATEAQFPQTFEGMYVIWCRTPPS